ncbi:MAG: hypothetical protein R3338_10770, partial [Thermoanaerobaculia bacterium]|nr:hypothetical protein [Thermoanaerobaculia bacterium]
PPDGEIGRMVAENDCGAVVAPGESTRLAQVIRELAMDRARCDELGRNARRAFDEKWSSSIAFEKWRRILKEAGDVPRNAG